MIVVAQSVVEALDIADEDLALPLLCRCLGVDVVRQQECKLHAGCLDLAGLTFARGARHAADATKDGKSEHRGSNSIEANALSCILGRDTLRCFFHIRFIHSSIIHLPILHRALYKAAFTTDRFVAELFEAKGQSVVFGRAELKSALELVEQTQIRLVEYIEVSLIFFKRRDPARVDSEEESEFFSEVALLHVGARHWRYPKCLRVSLYKEIMKSAISHPNRFNIMHII